MAIDDTKAGLERVLAALTADEPPPAVASFATPPATGPLDEALRETRLELWYQPKIDIKQRCLAGAEALARIRDPDKGVLLPASFLPGVSDDVLARLTEHALLTVLRDWSIFDEAGFNLRLAINVPVHLLDRLPIEKIVTENRPKAEYWPGLIVEVTEDQIVRDIRRSQEIAAKLRVSGISVAIDDFGAGYSSFSSLRELSFAELKLNHSFVKGCASDPTNAAICQTAIDLAHRFGSAAVAEGIETIADLQAMQIMGCDFGQGHLIAPPMPKQEFMALLQQRMNKPKAKPAEPVDETPSAEEAAPTAASA
ncbi:MAG TPA: EAL domain-containing protein [Xanthobacteraceae bacterium]|jgi:EAL domain-containing protein (putative c-di-GMP-specific phosphodiesterase class I)